MKRVFGILIVALIVLTACGQENSSENKNESNGSDSSADQASLEPVEVEMLTPTQLDVSEQTLSAKVTHNGESITNAQEVEFEVWETGSKDSGEMLTAEHHENGEYQVNYSFEESGSYYIQYHVTAKDQHVMPKHEVTVGSEESVSESDESNESSDSHSHGDEEGHHHHSNTVETTINIDWSEQTLDISSELNQEGQPFNGANVTFEITSIEDENLHEWVTAEEIEEGHYTGSLSGLSVNEVTIMTHIKKDDLHEHSEETVQK